MTRCRKVSRTPSRCRSRFRRGLRVGPWFARTLRLRSRHPIGGTIRNLEPRNALVGRVDCLGISATSLTRRTRFSSRTSPQGRFCCRSRCPRPARQLGRGRPPRPFFCRSPCRSACRRPPLDRRRRLGRRRRRGRRRSRRSVFRFLAYRELGQDCRNPQRRFRCHP